MIWSVAECTVSIFNNEIAHIISGLQHRPFVANTIADIAKVFPDHEKIWSLGCGSAVNLPVIFEGQLAATINMLHEEYYYSPARVELIERYLSLPAKRACLAALTA